MASKNLFSVFVLSTLFLISCNKENEGGSFSGPSASGPSAAVSVAIENISENDNSTAKLAVGSVKSQFADAVPGWIYSTAPDYLKVTLLKIALEGDFSAGGFNGDEYLLWSGQKELMLTGDAIDVSDINAQIDSIPIGTLTNIKVTFQSQAKVKGDLTGEFKLDDSNGPDGETGILSVYTKSDLAYDAVMKTGGADDYSAFEAAPAEESIISLDAFGDELVLEYATTQTFTANSSPELTIFFDLNRVLRFFNGKAGTTSGGVNPDDPGDKAYFFSHSLFGEFIAVYFGAAGSIEGYATSFENGDTAVNGWLSLVFDADDNFLSGIIIGDNDNDLSIAKGRITTFEEQSDGSYNFSYELNNGDISFEVNGFERVTQINTTSTTSYSGSLLGSATQGNCTFELRLKQ